MVKYDSCDGGVELSRVVMVEYSCVGGVELSRDVM